jgi:hypothetical protein
MCVCEWKWRRGNSILGVSLLTLNVGLALAGKESLLIELTGYIRRGKFTLLRQCGRIVKSLKASGKLTSVHPELAIFERP